MDYDKYIQMLRRVNEYLLDSRGIVNSTQLFSNPDILFARGIIGEAASILRLEQRIAKEQINA